MCGTKQNVSSSKAVATSRHNFFLVLNLRAILLDMRMMFVARALVNHALCACVEERDSKGASDKNSLTGIYLRYRIIDYSYRKIGHRLYGRPSQCLRYRISGGKSASKRPL